MIKYDLIVVGTGFASTFFLKKFLEKQKDKKILVLERGNLYPYIERLKAKRGESSEYEKNSPSYLDTFVNHHPEKAWRYTNNFGGSSNCWWGCTPRFMPSDFKMKSLYGIEQDWPIDYDELEKYYEEVEQLMFVSGPEETPFPRKNIYPLPPHLFAPPDQILHTKYGVEYISQPTARARQAVDGRNQCLGNATCELCPVNAKFTIENSNIDVYSHENVTISYGANAYALTIVNNKATQIHYVQDKVEKMAVADMFILGANPFFNTNILLNSGDKNSFTGKGFGEQLGIQTLIYLENMRNTGGTTWVNANGYMLYDGEHRKQYAGCLIETNNAPYIRLEENKWYNIMSFRLIFEDLPQSDNYITTTDDKLIPQIYYNAGRSQYALKAFEEAKKKIPKMLDCLPVEAIKYLDPFPNEGHILGGTRMGTSPQNSVVDKHLIHHQYKNVMVLGAGSFTTYTPSNPTLTLSALSLYAADKVF